MPRILVLTLSFGSGHPRAAQAIAKELADIAPRAEVWVVDALEDCRLLFRGCYEWPYWLMLRYAPVLWERLSAARLKHKHENTAPTWAFRLGCPRVFEAIEEFKPDVILAVEVAACEMAVIARRSAMTRAPIVNVITDYEAEPIWVKPEIEVFAVADEQVSAELIEWGAPASKITTCGIPVDPSFTLKHDETATRRRYGIRDGFPLVLLMGGGMGPTRMDRVAQELAISEVPMHIVAVAGRDQHAGRRLARLKVRPPVSLRVLGWSDEVPALMQAASVLVTKPGGLTVLEGALSSLPMVLFDPIPGAEFVNAKRMVDAGAAVITNGASDTAAKTVSLLRDEPARRAMSQAGNSIARPHARREIAQIVLELATPRKTVARRMTA